MGEWWSEWSSYRPSDFLLFSARTYQRMFESYNAQVWPVHVLALALGLGVLTALALRRPSVSLTARVAFASLGVAWLWMAWAFHWQRYAQINWAATWFAAGFAVQGALMLVAASFEWQRHDGARGWAGLMLLGFAIVVQPWLTLALTDRPWTEAELFGLAPDPTAIGTVGLLLAMRLSARSAGVRMVGLLLWPMALTWCLIGGMTRWTLCAACHA
ncbi:DUF6064 family protein [Variovorax dokdonensis]|uniref:DUF6064 family protein n=1 Tax=Variovorax dokdonensis TaxID=344883 RepID=A0ABT7NDW8_9BURK|nr:DUF6064 family protein [Variovorax dokdonensis]MDM0046133.1 DUF6064 family protein [Variovorax dokdonensis]